MFLRCCFFKQKTAYEMRISDWSSDVCSSDLRSVYDDVCQKIVEKVRNIRLGDPLDLATEMGPVANRMQRDKILGMIRAAEGDGARVAIGGRAATGPGLDEGSFVEIGRASGRERVCQYGMI